MRPLHLVAWLLPAALILLPLWAMKSADPAAWDAGDLPFAIGMSLFVSFVFEAAIRMPGRWAYAAGALLGAGTAALLVLGNLAVGFAGSEDNAINLVFFAVPVIALVGVVTARLRPSGLWKAMALTAAAQAAAGLFALLQGHFTGPLTVTFCGLWLASALLFRRSPRLT